MVRGSGVVRAALPIAAAVLTLVLGTGVSHATFVGSQTTTSLGPPGVGAGWLAVPVFEASNDPGTISGTPVHTTTASVAVARLSGTGELAFRYRTIAVNSTTGPALVAASPRAVVLGWTTSDHGGQIDTSLLTASGQVVASGTSPGQPTGRPLRLAVGPDGAYVAQWVDAAGTHAEVVRAGQRTFSPAVAANTAIGPDDSILLAGGDAAWLVSRTATGVGAAPITLGQQSAPQSVPVLGGAATTTLVDGGGNLWMLGHAGARWVAARVERAGGLARVALSSDRSHVAMALGQGRAFLAYRGARCHTYLQQLLAHRGQPGAPLDLTPRTRRCSAPTGIAVDQATGSAYVLVHSARGTALVVVRRGAAVSVWPGQLGGHTLALVATGSNRVFVETVGPQRDVGPVCGGASDSFETPYTFRLFHGPRLERSGALSARVEHC